MDYILFMSLKWSKLVKLAKTSEKLLKNHHFGTIDDVISPDDNIFRFCKCYHCVPGHISYRIRDMICVKNDIIWV